MADVTITAELTLAQAEALIAQLQDAVSGIKRHVADGYPDAYAWARSGTCSEGVKLRIRVGD